MGVPSTRCLSPTGKGRSERPGSACRARRGSDLRRREHGSALLGSRRAHDRSSATVCQRPGLLAGTAPVSSALPRGQPRPGGVRRMTGTRSAALGSSRGRRPGGGGDGRITCRRRCPGHGAGRAGLRTAAPALVGIGGDRAQRRGRQIADRTPAAGRRVQTAGRAARTVIVRIEIRRSSGPDPRRAGCRRRLDAAALADVVTGRPPRPGGSHGPWTREVLRLPRGRSGTDLAASSAARRSRSRSTCELKNLGLTYSLRAATSCRRGRARPPRRYGRVARRPAAALPRCRPHFPESLHRRRCRSAAACAAARAAAVTSSQRASRRSATSVFATDVRVSRAGGRRGDLERSREARPGRPERHRASSSGGRRERRPVAGTHRGVEPSTCRATRTSATARR